MGLEVRAAPLPLALLLSLSLSKIPADQPHTKDEHHQPKQEAGAKDQ